MAELSLLQQVATLNSTLSAIESRLAGSQAPVDGLEDFKSALDDMRLRLWGLLSSMTGDDHKVFQEQFRIRRVNEMCRGLMSDLSAGTVSGRHAELGGLVDAAAELARSIVLARQHAF
jgi:hypothetical protein